MKRVLAIIVPILEIGKNGKWSFSRERNNLYTITDTIDFGAIFGQNKNGFAYLTIKGARILERLAKANIINLVASDFEIDTAVSNNLGICAEYTAITLLGAKKADRKDDLNGVDCWLYDIPIQIKSCVHGISEMINYLDTDSKKNGISVINASITDLYEIIK